MLKMKRIGEKWHVKYKHTTGRIDFSGTQTAGGVEARQKWKKG